MLTKEGGFEFCHLTLLLLTKENNNELYFVERNLSTKLYKLLKSMNPLLKKDNAYEKTFPFLFLLNLATKKEFHLVIGQFILASLSENQNNLEDLFQSYLHNFNFFLSYIRIYIPHFLDMLVLYIYDAESDYTIRKWCFTIIVGLFSESSRFNSFSMKDEAFIEKILFYLRIEKDDYLKKSFIKLLKGFLKDNFSLRILKAFLSKSIFLIFFEIFN